MADLLARTALSWGAATWAEVTFNCILKYFTVPLFGFSSSGSLQVLFFSLNLFHIHHLSFLNFFFFYNHLLTSILFYSLFLPHPPFILLYLHQGLISLMYIQCELHSCDAIIFFFHFFSKFCQFLFHLLLSFHTFPQCLCLCSMFLVCSGNPGYFLFAKEHITVSSLFSTSSQESL